MADIKISDLTAASSASGNMQFEVNDGGSSKRVTADQIKAFAVSDGSIDATKLATDAVTTVKIQNLAVTTGKIADAAVTSAKLSTTGVTAGSYGSASAVPVITVDTTGRVTALSTASVSGGQYLGTATVKAIAYNAQTIGENITIAADQNGLSAGPITVNSGSTVTISSGGNWVIV
jgi:hypothetical protein